MAEEKAGYTDLQNCWTTRKAKDVLALRVSQPHLPGGLLVIATGHNPSRPRPCCEHLDKQLSEKGLEPRRVEGRGDNQWIVMDYADVIVHLFTPRHPKLLPPGAPLG